MKVKKSLCVWGVIFLWVLGLSLAGIGPQAEAAAPDFLFRCAGTMPLDHFMTKTLEHFAKLLQDKSQGRLKTEIYPVNQLFSDKDLPKALPSGAVDMGQVNTAMWSGLIPLLAVEEMPFFYKDRDHFFRAMLSPSVRNLLDKEFEGRGVKLLFWMDYGYVCLLSKKPIHTLEDFKGKRIRGYGEISTEILKALGAAPVFMSIGEVYMALQRGTIDGVLSSTCSVYERKFHEVVKHFTLIKVGEIQNQPAVLVNLKKYQELPPDLQKAMIDAAKEAQDWGLDIASKETDECLTGLQKKGVQVYYLPEQEKNRWAEASKSIMTNYLARTGPAGKALIDEVNKTR
ncbi:MAG: TRAP transporter substrate-binding protein DctP [Deltaproteobacteria bacterium]|nr:TRAP transporter substrate-binding protein DctP [Deltaproteobacteria bacterium]